MSAETSSKPNIFAAGSEGRKASLEELIRGEIGERGPVSFARFMELALYHPELGYYERHPKQTGRSGDFYTSVSVGSLFGELLGFEFAARLTGVPGRVSLAEAGAHDGELARDILGYLEEYRPGLFERLDYRMIEPSPRRREAQAAKLGRFRERVVWREDWAAAGAFRGICFSNELLDAMPVHVLRWSAAERGWREWGVEWRAGRFEWAALPEEASEAAGMAPEIARGLAEVLPDGYGIEVCPGAVKWWGEAARALEAGWLMTADYGLAAEEWFRPERTNGTLRGYHRHKSSGNVLEDPGERDITAHVDFGRITAAGEAAGLVTEGLERQEIFLKRVVERIEADPGNFPLWTPMRYRQLKSLMHPEHLGRAFRFLAQRREIGVNSG